MNNNRGYNTRSSLNNNDYNKNSAILDKGYSTNNRGVYYYNLGICRAFTLKLKIKF